MYINSYLESSMIDLSQYCITKVIEECAVQINIGNHFIILLCICRSPSGNFGEFAVQLDLKYLYVMSKTTNCSKITVYILYSILHSVKESN